MLKQSFICMALVALVLSAFAAPVRAQDDTTTYPIDYLGISFDYPTDWFISAQPVGIFISDDEAAIQTEVANPTGDTLVLQLGAFTSESLTSFVGRDIADAADTIVAFEEIIITEVGSAPYGSRDFTYADTTYTVNIFEDPNLISGFYFFDLETSVGQLIMSVTVYAADAATFEARITEAEAIIRSIQSDLGPTPDDADAPAEPSGETATALSQDGLLTLQYPVEWVTATFPDGVYVGDDADAVGEGTTAVKPGRVIVAVAYLTPDQLTQALGAPIIDAKTYFDSAVAGLPTIGVTVIGTDTITLGGRELLVIYTQREDGVFSTLYIEDLVLGGQDYVIITGSYALGADTLAARTAEIESVIATIRPADDTTSAPTGDDGLIYTQNYPNMNLFEGIQFSDGRVFLTDGFALYPFDVDTSGLGEAIAIEPLAALQYMTVAPDDTIWAVDADRGLVHLDSDFAVISTTLDDAFLGSVFGAVTATDDAVYMMTSRLDDDGNLNGRMFVFDTDGNVVRDFATTAEPNSPYAFGVFVLPQTDGNLLMLNGNLGSRVIDGEGNVIAGGVNYGQAAALMSVPTDVVRDDEGRLIAFSFGQLAVLDVTGNRLALYGDGMAAVNNQTGGFGLGEFGLLSNLLLLDDGRVLVIGGNAAMGTVTLLDPLALE